MDSKLDFSGLPDCFQFKDNIFPAISYNLLGLIFNAVNKTPGP